MEGEWANTTPTSLVFGWHRWLSIAFIFGPDGLSKTSVLLDCEADGAAIESAKQFRCDHNIELWQRDRKIAKLGPRTPRTSHDHF